jgi:hypothetical protein
MQNEVKRIRRVLFLSKTTVTLFPVKVIQYCRAYVATIIDGVLDLQLDLLDNTIIHNYRVYTSLFTVAAETLL